MSKIYNTSIQNYINRYIKYKRVEEISIRKIVQDIKPDRATHMIHPYPAKLLLHIPYFFLNNNILSKEGDTILDPFCGSGTVLLEAQLANRKSIGIDTNPLAKVITEPKLEKYSVNKLKDYKQFILNRLTDNIVTNFNNFENIDYWYTERIKKELSIILKSINEIKNLKYRKFFIMCFSNCVRKVSFADPKVSVPVKLELDRYDKRTKFYKIIEKRVKYIKYINVKKKFLNIVDENIKRVYQKNILIDVQCESNFIEKDLRNIFLKSDTTDSNILKKNSVDLVITSPPYAGSQKYIRASKLNLGWLGLASNGDLQKLDSITIGRENYSVKDYIKYNETGISSADKVLENIHRSNPLRSHITSNYLIEMKDAFTKTVSLLKNGGYLILIIGNNNICGLEFNTQKYLTIILQDLGLSLITKLVDNIKSYGLMTKRNKTADIINREWILVFKK